MANYANQYNYLNNLQTLTREGFATQKVIDTYFKSNKAFQYARMKGMYDTNQRGGLAITWPINTGVSPNTTTFDGDDTLPIASNNTLLQRPSLKWARYTDALTIPVTDIIDNNGSEEAIGNLLDVQLDIMKASLIDKISYDWIQNTQAINPKGLNGLAEGIDDGTVAPTYAGLNKATLGYRWKGNVNYSIPNGTNAALIANLHTLDLQASIDGQRPDFYFTNALNFGQLIQSLFPQDSYVQPEMARSAGGNDLIFNGNPIFLDNHVQTGIATPGTPPGSGTNSGGYFYGVNSSYFKMIVNPSANFLLWDWQVGQNNLVVFTRILWFANVAIIKPSSHFVAWIQGG